MENQNVEYKQEWKDEYLKWVCGFANAFGGKIYIGIDDKGLVQGLSDAQRLLEDLPNKIVNFLGIVAEINMLGNDGKQYIEVCISPSDVPVSYKGIYYYRSGSTKQELKGAALTQFLLKKTGKSWDDMICETAELDDIDESAIRYFITKASEHKRVAEDSRNDTLPEILDNLNLLSPAGKLKNASILLFGKKPMKFFPSVQFKIGRFVDSNHDLRFQDVIEGNIIEMADKVVEILKSKYLISPVSYAGLQRIEALEIPEDALREAIFNAIIHKDYTGAAIQLSVYNDKLVLWNEGKLPEGFTIETLREKHPSKPHNKKIADVFFKAGFIEAWGRGISKIISNLEKVGLQSPIFEEKVGGIMLTIFRQTSVDRVTDKVTDKVTDRVTDKQMKIIELVRNDKYISTAQMSAEIGISKRKIIDNIARLKNLQLLKRMGGTKRGYWEVIE